MTKREEKDGGINGEKVKRMGMNMGKNIEQANDGKRNRKTVKEELVKM